jgi:hypothetical protein
MLKSGRFGENLMARDVQNPLKKVFKRKKEILRPTLAFKI